MVQRYSGFLYCVQRIQKKLFFVCGILNSEGSIPNNLEIVECYFRLKWRQAGVFGKKGIVLFILRKKWCQQGQFLLKRLLFFSNPVKGDIIVTSVTCPGIEYHRFLSLGDDSKCVLPHFEFILSLSRGHMAVNTSVWQLGMGRWFRFFSLKQFPR